MNQGPLACEPASRGYVHTTQFALSANSVPQGRNAVNSGNLWVERLLKIRNKPTVSYRTLLVTGFQFPPPPPKFHRKFGPFSRNPPRGIRYRKGDGAHRRSFNCRESRTSLGMQNQGGGATPQFVLPAPMNNKVESRPSHEASRWNIQKMTDEIGSPRGGGVSYGCQASSVNVGDAATHPASPPTGRFPRIDPARFG